MQGRKNVPVLIASAVCKSVKARITYLNIGQVNFSLVFGFKFSPTILIRKKPTGTLVNDALVPGKRLWMFSTGTGIAPFASLIRDPETYDKFEEVILTHTCREVSELKYGQELIEKMKHARMDWEETHNIEPEDYL